MVQERDLRIQQLSEELGRVKDENERMRKDLAELRSIIKTMQDQQKRNHSSSDETI